jgi:photosystem II stability/assembly factor-like uncharacterized protein
MNTNHWGWRWISSALFGNLFRLVSAVFFILALFFFPFRTQAQNQPDLVSLSNTSVFNFTGTEIFLYGAQFENPPVVTVGSLPLAQVTWLSAGEVKVVIPQDFPAGIYSVTLANPGGLSDTLVDALTVYDPGPQPGLISVNPTSVVNDTPHTLTLTGSSFHQWTQVLIGADVQGTVNLVSASELQVTLPAGFSAGVFNVSVSNPGNYTAILSSALTVHNPSPSISGVAPTEVLNDANERLVITGSNFVPGAAVLLGGTTLADVTHISPGQIEALLPWGWNAGTYDLRVVNPGPGSPAGVLTGAVKVTSAFGVWANKGPYGGNAQGIYVHPANENIVFASMSSVGLFRSTDGGTSWQKLHSQPPTAFAFAPSNPNILYSAMWTLQKSSDGGTTWNQVSPWGVNFSGTTVLLVHPTNPDLVYAGIQDPTETNAGFLRSTDGGSTWTHAETGMGHHNIAGAVFHPENPQRIFAVTTDGYVYETIDGGDQWVERGQPVESFSSLAINPFGDHDLWAGQCTASESAIHGMIKALPDNLAASDAWESIAIFENTGYCYTLKTVFDPFQSGVVYVSANTLGYKTTDGGGTWQEGLADRIQLMDFALSGANHNTIYAAHWGKGIIKSLNGGQTWTKINQGLAAVVPSALAIAAENPDEVYVGANPYGLYWSESGGHTWLERGEYNGSVSLATDPFVPGRVYSSVWNGLKVSADHGETWAMADIDIISPNWCLPTVCTGGGGSMGVGPDPSTPGKILTGIAYHFDPPSDQVWPGGIYISTDYGATFTPVEYDVPRGSMELFAFAPTDPNVVYAAGYGGMLRSENGGLNWEDISPAGVPHGQFASLVVHPSDAQTIFTTFYGVEGVGGVYRSTDGGQTWQRIAPLMGWALVAQQTPTQQLILYLGGMDGLWSSYDNGVTWTRAAGELGYANITRLAFAQDSKRYVLYVGAAGGINAPAGASLLSTSSAANAGLYRKTQPVPDHWVFLPVVIRK